MKSCFLVRMSFGNILAILQVNEGEGILKLEKYSLFLKKKYVSLYETNIALKALDKFNRNHYLGRGHLVH